MFWSKAWLLVAVCLLWISPYWVNTVSVELCRPLETLREHLNSSLRRRYMKQNFPINYTIQVRYEDVFRLHNISRLMNEENPASMTDLQDLWLTVSLTGIKRILWVLPERHPTRRRYLTDLESLFKKFEQTYALHNPKEERELPESIQNIWERLSLPEGWRSVTPKSLLDNCYRTMHCLFKDCFTKDNQYDYCDILHWRKGKRTTPQPT